MKLERSVDLHRLDEALACFAHYALSIREVALAERTDPLRSEKEAAAYVWIKAAALPMLKRHDQILEELAGASRALSFHMHASGPVAVQVNDPAAGPLSFPFPAAARDAPGAACGIASGGAG